MPIERDNRNVNDAIDEIVQEVNEELEEVNEALEDLELPYKKYVALLTQSGTSNPTVTVLENTLSGTPTVTRDGAGYTKIELTGEFTANKCYFQVTLGSEVSGGANDLAWGAYRNNANTCYVWTAVNNVLVDAILTGASLEIRVYN
jgi:hypothetical protein